MRLHKPSVAPAELRWQCSGKMTPRLTCLDFVLRSKDNSQLSQGGSCSSGGTRNKRRSRGSVSHHAAVSERQDKATQLGRGHSGIAGPGCVRQQQQRARRLRRAARRRGRCGRARQSPPGFVRLDAGRPHSGAAASPATGGASSCLRNSRPAVPCCLRVLAGPVAASTRSSSSISSSVVPFVRRHSYRVGSPSDNCHIVFGRRNIARVSQLQHSDPEQA